MIDFIYFFIQYIVLYIYYCIFPYRFTDEKLTDETIKKYEDL